MNGKHDSAINIPVLLLMAGDTAAILLFTAGGNEEHRMGLDLAQMLKIAFPYLICWLIAGSVTGAYRSSAYSGIRQALLCIAYTLLFAHPAAFILRFVLYHKPVLPAFVVISGALIWSFLAVWRSLFTVLSRKLSNRTHDSHD